MESAGTNMNAVNNFPKPVIIGVVVVLVAIAGFVIFRTANNIATNNGYGSREDIARLQAQGGSNSQGGGHTATEHAAPSQQGYGRGGYPSGYGRGPGR